MSTKIYLSEFRLLVEDDALCLRNLRKRDGERRRSVSGMNGRWVVGTTLAGVPATPLVAAVFQPLLL